MSDKNKEDNLLNLPFIPAIFLEPDYPNKQFLKISLIILATMTLALLSSISYLIFFAPTEEGAFFKESELGEAAAIYNFFTFLFLVVTFSIILYILIKLRKFNILHILQAVLLGFICGTSASLFIPLWIYLTAYYFGVLNIFLSITKQILIVFFLVFQVFLFVLFFALQVFSILFPKSLNLRNILLVLTSAWVGTLLGLTLGRLTPIIFMIGFAIYDIFAVFKGPLKKISDELKTIMGNLRDRKEDDENSSISLILGLGDLFFYSLAVSYSYAYLNIIVTIIVLGAILVGSLLTILISLRNEERKALPALPIPMFLALLIIFFASII